MSWLKAIASTNHCHVYNEKMSPGTLRAQNKAFYIIIGTIQKLCAADGLGERGKITANQKELEKPDMPNRQSVIDQKWNKSN